MPDSSRHFANKRSLYKPVTPWVPAPARTSKTFKTDVKDSHCHGRDAPCRDEKRKANGHSFNNIVELRAQADLEAARQQLRNQKVELARSREALNEQEEELYRTKTDKEFAAKMNSSLRRSMEFLKDESMISRTERDIIQTERDLLSQKLLSIELEGEEASSQMIALRDTLSKLREDKRLSMSEMALLDKQRGLLLDKLAAFETSNRGLRHLLREHAQKAIEAERLAEQRDSLLTRLSDSEHKITSLTSELRQRDDALHAAKAHCTSSQHENEVLAGHQKSLEQTRAHLQKQLRSKEADCNRMAVQIRSLEGKLEQDRYEMDHLHALVKSTKETQAADFQAVVDNLRSKLVKLSKDKGQLEAENAHLVSRLSELDASLQQTESNTRHHTDRLQAQLQDREATILALRTDNDKYRVMQTSLEDRVLGGTAENGTLRSANSEMETQLEDYRTQLSFARSQNSDLANKLDQANKDIVRLQHDNLAEIEKSEQTHLEVNRQHSKFLQSQEDNVQLSRKLDTLERKVKDLEEDNQEIIVRQAKTDEQNSQMALQLEDKGREIAQLSRQLDISIADGKRAAEASHAKIVAKERNSHARIMELEAQLGRAKAELSQVRRAKDEADRKFNTRLQDLRDRLEQSHVTNRSMQNYIGFLKAT